MKKTLTLLFCMAFVAALHAFADTTILDATKLRPESIVPGKSSYIVYTKKDKNSPAANIVLVEMEAIKTTFNQLPSIQITQKWSEKDTLIHYSETILDEKQMSTLFHKIWWKRTGETAAFDFLQKKCESDLVREEAKMKAFHEQFAKAAMDERFINWHCDLHFFGILPFKEGAVFKLNLYDPGFGVPKYETYAVKASEKIEGYDCWVLEYTLPKGMGYQRFWISKADRVVIKEEDSFRGTYRYKLKTKVAE